MPSFRQASAALLICLTLVACRRDPNVAKKQYLESGNKYFDRGLYKPAAIQYQNAIKIDGRYGPAHYKLAIVYLKEKPAQLNLALKEYRKAVDLLQDNQAYQEEFKQALIRLSELNLVFVAKSDKTALDDVKGYLDQLAKKDPNSFDLFRLTGDLDYVRAKFQAETNPAGAEQLYATAMESYRKADAIKPNDSLVAIQIALILTDQKQYAAAEPYFRKVIDNDKTSNLGYMSLYRLYMREQKIPEAEQLLKEAIQNNPKTAEYLERLAFHYGSLGRRDDMLNVLQQIKSHAKDFEAVNQVVGNFYLRLGDADAALREFREGIVKDPKRKAAYQHAIVEVLLRQGKRAEAAEVNTQVLKENPKDADAKSLAATFQLDSGDVASALAQLQSVVTSSPDNAVAHYELGRAYLASGKPDSREAARTQFERAIGLRPDMISPRLGLAELQVTMGQFQAAQDTIREILKRDPQNVNARLIQSQAFVGQQKYGESDSLLASMMKANPSSPEVYYQAGISDLSQNKPQEAETAFMRAYELNPANSKSLLGVVDADLQAGKADRAMTLLEGEAKKYPNRLDIQLLMGTTAQKEGKYSDALNYFNRVLNGLDKKAPVRADLYMQIANTYRLQGDRDASIANMMKARELKPDNDTVLSALGLLLSENNRKTEARQAYEASLRVNPNNPYTLNNLAYLMAETGSELDLALNYAQRAKQLSPNTAEISDSLGWILLKKGLPEQAIPVFKDLVNRYPDVSTYHYHLAMGFNQRGDNGKAMEELREAQKHSPPKDEQKSIQEMIAKIGGK